jgi:hypothetical protein
VAKIFTEKSKLSLKNAAETFWCILALVQATFQALNSTSQFLAQEYVLQ